MSISIALLLIFSLCFSTAHAQPPRLLFSKKINKNTTTIYKIQKGDTLFGIIRSLGCPEKRIPDMLRKVLHLNQSLSPNKPIHPGQTILLPMAAIIANAPHQAVGSRIVPSPRDRTSNTPEVATYTFKRGDSLLKVLEKKTGLERKKLKQSYLPLFIAHNPEITNLNLIHQGQTITIPPPHAHNVTLAQPLPSINMQYVFETTSRGHRTPAQAKKYTETFLEALGFSFNHGKEAFFPRKPRGWLRIDLTKTPMLQTPWGEALLLIPQQHILIAQTAKKAGLSPCTIPDSWEPGKVISAIARHAPHQMTVYPPTTPYIRTQKNVQIMVQTEILLDAAWTNPPRTYALQVVSDDEPLFPALLTSLLHQENIILLQWKTEGASKKLISVRQHLIHAHDIYVPTISLAQLTLLPGNKHGAPAIVPEFPPIPENIPHKTRIDLTWKQPRGHISLSMELLTFSTEEERFIFLDPSMKAPYLIALLGIKGLDSFVLKQQDTLP